MPSEKFANKEYYHVYNRGVEKRDVFLNNEDYIRFLKSIRTFNNIICKKTSDVSEDIRCLQQDQLVEFIAYCLNPNHYHFILRQLVDGGISEFMRRLGNGYTKYFNYKYNHSGFLFQGKFKAKHIDSDAYLLWASVYVNANAEIHDVTQRAAKYKWCSCSDYFGLRNGTLCEKEVVLGQFHDHYDYRQYMNEILPLIRTNKEFKKYVFE